MYPLDDYVLRLAVAEARRLIGEGFTLEDAAGLACRGAWQDFIPLVQTALAADADGQTDRTVR